MTTQWLLIEDNPDKDITINDLETAYYIYHLQIVTLLLYPLKHIATHVDNTEK